MKSAHCIPRTYKNLDKNPSSKQNYEKKNYKKITTREKFIRNYIILISWMVYNISTSPMSVTALLAWIQRPVNAPALSYRTRMSRERKRALVVVVASAERTNQEETQEEKREVRKIIMPPHFARARARDENISHAIIAKAHIVYTHSLDTRDYIWRILRKFTY